MPRLLTLCLLGSAVWAAEQSRLEVAGQTVDFAADHISYDAPSARVYLVGHAQVGVGETVFTARQIVFDLADPQRPAAMAEGDGVLTSPKLGRVEVQRLRYDFAADRGELTDLQLTMPLGFKPSLEDLLPPDERPEALRIRAREAAHLGTELVLQDAAMTTSDRARPQYEVRAGRVRVGLGSGDVLQAINQLEASGVAIALDGLTLYAPTLDLARGSVFFPVIGTNTPDGLFIQQSFKIGGLRPGRFEVTPRLGTSSFLTGRGTLGVSSRFGDFELTASRKEPATRLLDKDSIQLSRLPELEWRSPAWQPPEIGGRFRGRVTLGWYDEVTSTAAYRHAYELSYDRVLHAGDTTRFGVDLGAHYAFYTHEGGYGWLRGGLTFERAFDYRLYLKLALTSNLIAGDTPFRFDEVEVPTELRTTARLRLTKQWLLRSHLLYDITHDAVRLQEYGITYRDRALEYGFSVMTLPRFEFQLQGKVVGF